MLNMLPRIIHPSETVIKKGSLIRLKFLQGKKVAILCGGDSFRKHGHLERMETYLEASKLEAVVIEGIKGDPSTTSIAHARDAIRLRLGV